MTRRTDGRFTVEGKGFGSRLAALAYAQHTALQRRTACVVTVTEIGRPGPVHTVRSDGRTVVTLGHGTDSLRRVAQGNPDLARDIARGK